MVRKILILFVAPIVAALAMPTTAHPWGGLHVGFTRYNPYTGLRHYGYTAAVGPYGGYRYGYRYGGYAGYHYGVPGAYYGGLRYGYGGVYRAGYYRVW